MLHLIFFWIGYIENLKVIFINKTLIAERKLKLFTNLSYILIFVSWIFAGCEDKSTPAQDFLYPLQQGNQWEYQKTFSYINIEPDSIDISPDTVVVEAEVLGRENLPGIGETIPVLTHEKNNMQSPQGINYYTQSEKGLFIQAYLNAGGPIIFPKHLHLKPIVFKGRSYPNIETLTRILRAAIPINALNSDSAIVEDPAVQTLKYPLEVGTQWTYRDFFSPWKIDKRVIDKGSITTPAGSFDCYFILWQYDIDNSGVWDDDIEMVDYVSETGLVKRTLTLEGVFFTDPFGELLIQADVIDEYVLTAYAIK
jgi:hypothetical protein